ARTFLGAHPSPAPPGSPETPTDESGGAEDRHDPDPERVEAEGPGHPGPVECGPGAGRIAEVAWEAREHSGHVAEVGRGPVPTGGRAGEPAEPPEERRKPECPGERPRPEPQPRLLSGPPRTLDPAVPPASAHPRGLRVARRRWPGRPAARRSSS